MLPVVLLLGACAGRAADAGPVERLRFTECADRLPVAEANIGQSRLDRLEFSCARLPVPLNHADPDGAQLSVAVVRVRSHDQQRRLGSLVLNPGGPGQSGSAYVAYWASWLSDDVLSRFDVVTFDPRGTGASEPIDCGPVPADTELSRFPDLLSETGYAAAAAVSRQPMDACAQVLGRRAPFFSTQQTARDLELLRQALGDRRLTYVGFSYGAKLGAEYAHQFPERVRALVLDAPSDPSKDPVAVTEAQVAAFERSFQSWADDCPARPTCAPLGDPRTYVADLVARAGDAPIASRRPGGDLPATGADVMEAVQALLYQQATWPLLDDALAEATAGDSGSIHEAIDHANGRSGADDGVPDPADAGLVINCNDRPPGPTEAEIKAAARRLTARLPVFGAWGSWGLFGCAFWPVERHVLEPPTAPTAALVLVVGSVGDPATPYAGAVRLVEALGHATLLTWEGNGHTAYGQSDCINHLVDDYLIRRAAPDPGTHCPG
ncbi:MAG: alpha/beta hydrolase [Sporichthyaceae bacterium]